MPRTRALLDSSPIAPGARPLKRSASTASLPTPPRTHHKRTHSRGHSPGSDSDSDAELQRGSNDGASLSPNKRRRTSLCVKGQTPTAAEDDFWVRSTGNQSPNLSPITRSSPSPVSPAPLAYHIEPKAPVSPPPSRRQVKGRIARPVTPKRGTSTSQVDNLSGPVRDSPHNPFLEDSPLTLDGTSPAEPRTPSPSTDFAEKPTITYVLYVHLFILFNFSLGVYSHQ
jgi:hypothetical protein